MDSSTGTNPSLNTRPITEALKHLRAGDTAAADRLFDLIYTDLRRMASAAMERERRRRGIGGAGGPSVEPGSTGLVAETYLRLADAEGLDFENRRHLFGAAARAMQRVLVDQFRNVSAQKRGFRMKRVPLDEGAIGSAALDQPVDWNFMEPALAELESLDPREAEIVRLRFVAGLTEQQTAAVLGISDRQVRRDWTHARAWLQDRLEQSGEHGADPDPAPPSTND